MLARLKPQRRRCFCATHGAALRALVKGRAREGAVVYHRVCGHGQLLHHLSVHVDLIRASSLLKSAPVDLDEVVLIHAWGIGIQLRGFAWRLLGGVGGAAAHSRCRRLRQIVGHGAQQHRCRHGHPQVCGEWPQRIGQAPRVRVLLCRGTRHKQKLSSVKGSGEGAVGREVGAALARHPEVSDTQVRGVDAHHVQAGPPRVLIWRQL
mmetsp:Transcript_23525/g.44855  ORF Transcript_23525/g.44855 Transcript_23525/m.44855 type:complete len:207 (+) Transcript_23525:1381-2001(+)